MDQLYNYSMNKSMYQGLRYRSDNMKGDKPLDHKLFGGKPLLENPILHEHWIEAKGYEPIEWDSDTYKHLVSRYNRTFGDEIKVFQTKSNVVQFGGGSYSGSWSLVLSDISDNLTVVDYSPQMIKIIRQTFEINDRKLDNVKLVNESMERYSDLRNADYIVFTFSMSFSNIGHTIRNLTNNCRKGCKVLIAETLKPILGSMRTDMSETRLREQIRWRDNLLKIEKKFTKNDSWEIEEKKIIQLKGEHIPNLILRYIKIK